MKNLNIYLSFDGNCLEAFGFYKTVFGGDFAFTQKYGDLPSIPGMPALSPDDKEKIENICLPLDDGMILMGSDTLEAFGQKLVTGNNFTIYLEAESMEEAERVFNGLSTQGIIKMPFARAHWGDHFGMLTDKYDINWSVNFSKI